MHSTTRGICAALWIGASALATGCLTTPPADLESTSQVTGRDAGPLPDSTPPVPTQCEQTPRCSVVPIKFSTPLQQTLGCSTSTEYVNGYTIGFTGGIGSFCPDTPAVREALHAANRRAYLPGFCTQCLTVPRGSLYVLWTELEGPGCPSSCKPGTPPSQL